MNLNSIQLEPNPVALFTGLTYQQSSQMRPELAEVDPFNRLLARQSRFRLDAEMVRDNALSVSGLLVRKVGGRSVKPYQPVGLYRHLNFPRRKYKADTDENQYRRGVYTHWQRQFLHPAMKAFDAPSREECTAQRSRSNTPLAALVLLNDPMFHHAAKKLAERVCGEAHDDDARLVYAFQVVLGRAPRAEEGERFLAFLQHEQADLNARDVAANERERERIDLRVWTLGCSVLLNLDETITRP